MQSCCNVRPFRDAQYVVVGSGFFGATVAERLASNGYRVVVIEKRSHIGGNSWSEVDEDTGIEVHKYGSHIFHTSNEEVWEYVNRFTCFNSYRHTVYTEYQKRTYSMPINLGTINAFYGLNLKPYEVDQFLAEERKKEHYEHPANLEEQAVSLIGRPLYEAFIKGYTVKQWGKSPTMLPASIINRLPVRNNYSNRYFIDSHEGIPIEGYGQVFRNMLSHANISLQLNTDWFDVRHEVMGKIPVVYTGPIDAFFDCRYGPLEWRTVEFERQVHAVRDFQGTAVVNYADPDVPWTRIHEFRHYHPERGYGERTITYREYSRGHAADCDPFYPVNTKRNMATLARYEADAKKLSKVWFGGRLASYRYLDMDMTIGLALKLAHSLRQGNERIGAQQSLKRVA